ncbi:MAG: 1-acyl-sn-glycerol-3-phosphate acyltransferase [Actinobacteria bacterium]|nr:1-acyl-sn-glycerol-3-phosphate acyltransferase [Actinomycetota bacterium]
MERHGRRRLSPTYWFAVATLWPTLTVATKRDWQGTEYLRRTYPPTDGIVVAANHLSWFDPLPMCHALWNNGRPPRILVKNTLFRVPFVGSVISGAGQIPVARDTDDAAKSVAEAVAAIADGEAVVVYPEGTITRDEQLWPMSGRSGAARIALESGAPVIPLAQWGPQQVMRPYRKEFRIFPRKTMHIRIGPPVDLDDLRGGPITAEKLAEATSRILDDITDLLAALRAEAPPEERLDFKAWKDSTSDEREQG